MGGASGVSLNRILSDDVARATLTSSSADILLQCPRHGRPNGSHILSEMADVQTLIGNPRMSADVKANCVAQLASKIHSLWLCVLCI